MAISAAARAKEANIPFSQEGFSFSSMISERARMKKKKARTAGLPPQPIIHWGLLVKNVAAIAEAAEVFLSKNLKRKI